MLREKLTAKLVRILETLDAGDVAIAELYLFGSYARGAVEPHDLDLLAVIVDPGPDYWLEQYQRHGFSGWGRFGAALRRKLVKPGEPIDFVYVQKLENMVGPGSTIPERELVRL